MTELPRQSIVPPPRPAPLDWQAIACASLHETQLTILQVFSMAGNPVMAPADVARVLAGDAVAGPNLQLVAYHVRQLRDHGLLELDETLTGYRLSGVAVLSGQQQATKALIESSTSMPVGMRSLCKHTPQLDPRSDDYGVCSQCGATVKDGDDV